MTPRHVWEDIKEFIPNKVIWEPFYGDGTSGVHLRDMGFEVIHEDVDFFEEDRGEVVVTNPAFSKIPEILKRLKDLNRPFIMIMPSSKINTQYFQKLFTSEIQLIVFLLETRVAEGRGVLDVMAVSTLPSKMRRVPKYRNFRSLS